MSGGHFEYAECKLRYVYAQLETDEANIQEGEIEVDDKDKILALIAELKLETQRTYGMLRAYDLYMSDDISERTLFERIEKIKT